MRILLIYPGHSMSTVDVATGHEKALRALGHDVKAFNYHNWLLFYNHALNSWAKENKDFDPPDDAFVVKAAEAVIIDVIDFVPDAVLIVHGMALHRRAYELMHRLGVPVFLLLTESPYNDEQQLPIIEKGHITAVFTNDKNSAEPLSTAGKPVYYLPHSYDPEAHYPRQVMNGYRSDVFFFGTIWPERDRLFANLHSNNGHIYNIGGIHSVDKKNEDALDNAELANYYAGATIALNHHRTIISGGDEGESHIQAEQAYSLGPRAYEIAACGAFQLCDDTRPELFDVFGRSVATYHDAEDLQAKIDYYLTHENERLEMAKEAHERVKDCTFINRAEQIIVPAIESCLGLEV